VEYVRRYADELRRAGTPADQVDVEAWLSYARIMLTASEFAVID